MNLRNMVLDSLKYPFSNLSRVGGLFLLLLGSIFIIPAILAVGYIFRIIENTTNGSNELPQFDEWKNMLGNGLKYIAVSLIYLIVPNILIFVLFRGYGDFQIYLLTTVIGFIIALPFDIVYVMALGNMAHEGRLGAAFDFSKIFGLIGKIGWPKYVAYILIFNIIGLLIGMIIDFSTFLPIFFGSGGDVLFIIITILVEIYLVLYRGRYIGLIYCEGSTLLKDGRKSEINPEIEKNQDTGTV